MIWGIDPVLFFLAVGALALFWWACSKRGRKGGTCEATVVSNNNIATFIKELVLVLPEGEEIPYRAGGYLQFHVPPFKTNTRDWREAIGPDFIPEWEKYHLFDREIDYSQLPTGKEEKKRAFSMASYPAEGRKLLFNVRIALPPLVADQIPENIPWGMSSSYAFSLKPGDKVRLSGPYGDAFMIPGKQELVFLIGGAGSSFGRSHILHLFHTENTNRKVTLWYGARSLKENIYRQEYEELEKKYPNFKYRLVLSDPLPEDIEKGWPAGDPLKTNLLYLAFEEGQLKAMKAPEEALFYVCGPPLHNKSVLKLLADYGVPRKNIILDDFWS